MRRIVVTVHDPDLRRLRQIGMRSIAASKNIEASREAEMNRNISAIVKKTASIKNAIILMVLIIVTGCLSGCGGDSSADRKVDVDLTDMSATMVYSEVFDMVNKPDEYIGKTIKMHGNIFMNFDEKEERIRCYCIIADATKCCQQGLEFVLKKEPDKYPEGDSEVTVVGTADKFKYEDGTSCIIKDAEFIE